MYYFLEKCVFNYSLNCLHYEYMVFFSIYRKIYSITVDIILSGELKTLPGGTFFCEFHMYIEVLFLGWLVGGGG